MKNRNICKFINDPTYDRLEVHRFIYESDPDVMKIEYRLEHHRAILVRHGKGTFKISNFPVSFDAGSLVFCFRGEVFTVENDGACEYMYIDFDGTRADALFRRFGISKADRSFAGFDGLIPLWHNSLSGASQMNIDLAAESVLIYTFSRLSGIPQEQSNIINKIVEISEVQFGNPDLSIAAISEELAYNPKYISHIFKEKMGVSYSEYLRTLRIKYAISLFDHGIDSVKNVAFLSGFTDPLYFSTVFKKTVGVSPKEYKKRR